MLNVKHKWWLRLPLLILVSSAISCASMRLGPADPHLLAEPRPGTADELDLLAGNNCTLWVPATGNSPGTAPLIREWLGRIYLQHNIDAVQKMRQED